MPEGVSGKSEFGRFDNAVRQILRVSKTDLLDREPDKQTVPRKKILPKGPRWMKVTVSARVVAKPVHFPDDIEMLYHCLDERGRLTGKSYGGVHFTWADVQRRFIIDADYAKECEGCFASGEAAFLGNREIIIEVDE